MVRATAQQTGDGGRRGTPQGCAGTAETLLMAPDRPCVVVSGAFFMGGRAHDGANRLKRARGGWSVMTGLTLLAFFIGGGAGATCRYGLGRAVGARYAGAFPLGTVLINVTGCFALGLVASLLALTHRGLALPVALLETGFLGGYTTFSTYALEGVLLYRAGARRLAAAAVLGPVALGLLAAAAGAAVGRLV